MRLISHNRMPRLAFGLTAAAAALVLGGCVSADGEPQAIGKVNVEKLCGPDRLAPLDPASLGRAIRTNADTLKKTEQTYRDMQEVICRQAGKLAASVVANAQTMPDDRPNVEVYMSLQRGENDPGVVVITEQQVTSKRQNTITFGANPDGSANLDDLRGVKVFSHEVSGDQDAIVQIEADYQAGRWTIRQAGGDNTATYPPEHMGTPADVQAAWDGMAAAAARLDPAHY